MEQLFSLKKFHVYGYCLFLFMHWMEIVHDIIITIHIRVVVNPQGKVSAKIQQLLNTLKVS